MTPGNIETSARRLLNAESSQFWSSTEIIEDYLYFCELELANECLDIENRYTQSSVASQAEYTKPSRTISIKRVSFDGEKLRPMTLRERDSLQYGSTLSTGTPEYYWEYDDVIGLYPTPDTGSLTIEMWTKDEPSRPTTTSTLSTPSQYHHALVYGVAYLMSQKELGHPNTVLLRNQWEDQKARIKRYEQKRKRSDKMGRVVNEDISQTTLLGIV